MDSFRRYFPITRHTTYFNHASTSPLPVPAARAIERVLKRYMDWADIPIDILWGAIEGTRELAARFLGCSKDEVAFVKNTSQGVLIAIQSLRWRKGDNIILLEDAFCANLYPFLHVLPRVEKRFLNTGDGKGFVKRLARLVDRRTRAISIDWVNWLSGVRLDLAEIGEFCRKQNIILMVDGMQGLGALQLDLGKTRIDFMMAGGSKWLLGPQGIGLLYVAKHRLGRLEPTNIGWLSAEIASFQKLLPLGPPKKSAARFEEGTKNLMGICGLGENLKLLLKVGMGNVEKRVLHLTDLVLRKAEERNFEILSPRETRLRSGIVSIRPRHMPVKKAYDLLRKRKIVVSLREGWLRISPHFYNTPSEVEKIFEVIEY